MEWVNIKSLSLHLERLVISVCDRFSPYGLEKKTSDEIIYNKGLFVELMNRILNCLNVQNNDAAIYDSISHDYLDKSANEIDFDKVCLLYNEFLKLYDKYMVSSSTNE